MVPDGVCGLDVQMEGRMNEEPSRGKPKVKQEEDIVLGEGCLLLNFSVRQH